MATVDSAVGQCDISASEWDRSIHPWRRYFARVIDLTALPFLPIILVSILVIIVAPNLVAFIESPPLLFQFLFLIPISYAVAGLATALFVHWWGTTPGKWIFGLKVLSTDGSRLSMRQAVKREARLLFWGLGLGLPLVSLFTMLRSYSVLEEDGQSRWDDAGSQVLGRPLATTTHVMTAVGFIIFLGVKALDVFAYASIFAR